MTTGICALASANLTARDCLIGETGQLTVVADAIIHYTVTFPDGVVEHGSYIVQGAWTVRVITVTEENWTVAESAALTLTMSSHDEPPGNQLQRFPGHPPRRSIPVRMSSPPALPMHSSFLEGRLQSPSSGAAKLLLLHRPVINEGSLSLTVRSASS